MANVYVIRDGGKTERMARVRCRDEDSELQSILENNPDLLPGDQIDPEDPRRWLLIKREMPVPDPNTGADRWSIDFFFVDQSAIPTFVECKRSADTRSRREIVGQMLEYAANGHYYWTKESIRSFATQTQARQGATLEDAFRTLQANGDATLEEFLETVQENLREGQLRIVFFLEESPMELRSVVDFLNKQMELSWVLLVEARQYTHNGVTVVVPTLFGYTEEARKAKRTNIPSRSSPRRKWDYDSFFADAKARLTEAQVESMRLLYEESAALGLEISWGTGTTKGSFNIKEPYICHRSLLSITSDGCLSINFPWLVGSEQAESGRERLKDLLILESVLPIPGDYASKWLGFTPSEWMPKRALLVQVLKSLISERPLLGNRATK